MNYKYFAFLLFLASFLFLPSCKGKSKKRTWTTEQFQNLTPIGNNNVLYQNKTFNFFLEFSQKLWKHPSTYEGAFSIDSDIQLSMPPDVLKERPNAYRGVNGDLRISLDHDVVKEYNQFIAGPSPEYRLEGSSISLTKGKMAINGIDFTYAIRQGYNEYTEADKKRLCYGCDDVDIPEERNFCYMIFYATTPAVILIRFYSYDFATASRFIPSKDEEARRGVERMKQEALKVIKTFRWYGPKNKEQR